MCAIIGAVGRQLPDEKKFIKARDVLAHRGPDDHGVYYRAEERVALGFRRLSIIDLSSAGHQPFFSNDGRFVLVFNGEIYNYLEIKKEIGRRYDFKTRTDTEVLLASYVLWGDQCLQKFNGMFSFAVWDKKTHTLFCARDRLGVKPFFYFLKNGTFYFSSEIKGLLALGAPRAPHDGIIFDYLSRGFYDHTDETFFEGIKSLRGGTSLVWKDGKVRMKTFWGLAEAKPRHRGLDDASIRATFKEILADAIKIRFRSDVPVGINLSSGLDSNSLLYYSKKILGKDIDTFSMRYPSKEYDECELVEGYLTSAQKKKWHTTTIKPKDVLEEAASMNEIQDQPFGGMPTIVYAHLNKLARTHKTTVLLEGQGVDELLAGYEYYRLESEKDRKHTPLGTRDSRKEFLSQDLSVLIDTEVLNQKFIKKHPKNMRFRAPFESHLLNAQYRDIVHTKLPRVLRFNDHVSMAYGRELRLPYLDYRFVEFCFFLPVRHKITSVSQKVLMREAMGRYLPHVVRATQKKSFGRVQGEWIRKFHKNAVYDILESASFKKREYWNHDVLMRKAGAFFSDGRENSFFLWQCINLELWFRKFID